MSFANDYTKNVCRLYFILIAFQCVLCDEEINFFAKDFDLSKDCLNNICSDGIFQWHKSKTKILNVGGIFPMVGGWPGGQSCLPSAIMALNQVNLNESILPNYRLKLNWFNSEVKNLIFLS